jgi:hypothetical protein
VLQLPSLIMIKNSIGDLKKGAKVPEWL